MSEIRKPRQVYQASPCQHERSEVDRDAPVPVRCLDCHTIWTTYSVWDHGAPGYRDPWLPWPSQQDPMTGAIDRALSEARGVDWPNLHLALNEAYRNGLRSGQEERTSTEVLVRIPGLPGPRPHGLWQAFWSQSHKPEVIYQVDGDPNAVAVGRFKASLRKFLGVDS